MKRTTKRRAVAAVVFLGPVFAAVSLHEAGIFRAADASLEDQEAGIRARLSAVSAAKKHEESFREELRKSALDLGRLQQILPYCLDVDVFRSDLERLASGRGVGIQEDATSFYRDGRLIAATMDVVIRGTRQDRQAFLARLSRRARQCTIEILEERDGFVRGKIAFWAWEPPHVAQEVPCAANVARMPWTPWTRDWIAARASTCRTLAREAGLDPDLEADVARYEHVKVEVRELVDKINEIQERNQVIWKKLLTARGGPPRPTRD